jgi:hypothetical protein
MIDAMGAIGAHRRSFEHVGLLTLVKAVLRAGGQSNTYGARSARSGGLQHD